MRALSKPMPGWVGRELLPLGVRPAMSLLASGWLTMDREHCLDGEAACQEEAERVALHYESLANSWDPVGDLKGIWERFTAERAWVKRNDVVAPFRDCQMDEERLRKAADVMATVDFDYLGCMADGDPLGAVHAEIGAQARRQAIPIDQGDLMDHAAQSLVGYLTSDALQHGRKVADLWCGSGRRIVGRAAALRMLGFDPRAWHWELSDPNPVLLACAAVNLDYYDLGNHVVMYVNEEHAQAWLAAAAAHRVPVTPFQAAHMDRVTEMMRD